ncbi:unnamed protein product, partial [Symbiodinium necroappetens]
EERKKRSEIASVVQVVVPAIDQFSETVEGHQHLLGDGFRLRWRPLAIVKAAEAHKNRFKIPDPPVPMNVRAAAADQSSGTHVHNTGMNSQEQREATTTPNTTTPARHTTLARTLAHLATGSQQGFMTIDQGTHSSSADMEAMEPCTFQRPCIATSAGRAEAHRGFQNARREYDEGCAASGITPEAGNLANAARICAPPATLHLAEAEFTPVLLGPSPADMVVDIFTHEYEYNATVQRIRNDWSGSRMEQTKPGSTVFRCRSGRAAGDAKNAATDQRLGLHRHPWEVDDEDSFVVPPECAGANPSTATESAATPMYAPPTPKAPAVDANKELIGKLRAEKEALLGENTRLVARLRETEDELAEARNHLRDAQFGLEEASRRAYRAERQLDELQMRRSKSRRRRSSSSPRERRRREEQYRRDDRDRRDDRYEIGRTARWGRDTDAAAGEGEITLASSPAYPPDEPPAAPPAELAAASSGATRATTVGGSPRGTATQPNVSI